jgi:membrane carboxypeptidase/penicillin-binding protein
MVQPDKKNVLRPDVAYIMDDIMKDVINRGTAAQAQAWGFRNVAGKTGFAGKTGTSRDGWFAGFTPELVCVVYVGFDDNDDLGMKGADSAMPIWADFMKAALERHPEWNGDWLMPTSVRKAEIDIRNGTLIRELDAADNVAVKATPTPTPQTTPIPELEDPAWATETIPEAKEVFVTNVPAEFRRVELFVGGTIPTRTMVGSDDETFDESKYTDPSEPTEPTPIPSPTPVTSTWEQHAEKDNRSKNSSEPKATVAVAICPITGMRATSKCPGSEIRSFPKGSEPKEFCNFHR